MAVSIWTDLAKSPHGHLLIYFVLQLRPTHGGIGTRSFDIVSGGGVIDADVGAEAGAGIAEGAGAGACVGASAGAEEGVATMATGVGTGT